MEKNAIFAGLIAFGLGIVFCVLLLPLLKKLKAGQEILSYVQEHKHKSGTPTMGGLAFVFAGIFGYLLFFRHSGKLALIALAITVGYCIVGFLDDFVKVFFKRNLGLKASQKIIVQLAIAFIIAFFVYLDPLTQGGLEIPFTDKLFEVGWWMVPLVIIVFLSCTNGVNLTDGIDGLAGSSTATYLVAFALILQNKANELSVTGELTLSNEYGNIVVLCMAFSGALLAFLLFNCFPAKIFMGDTGSMALGAIVACVAVFTRFTLIIPLLGVMFVVSCLSVIIQVLYFKKTKKRFFLMAPFHHHLQKKGWSETRITVVYSTITAIIGAILLLVW